MEVVSPSESVYYYECSHGRFRLTYFIPHDELQRLHSGERISSQALEDFPDGVDLGCTEADFDVFEQTYGFRPKQDPGALRRAFLAILSSTHSWQRFRGSGFLAAGDLERHVERVEHVLPASEPVRGVLEPLGSPASLKQRRQMGHRRAVRRKRTDNALRKMRIEGIDPKRTLSEQRFTPIKVSKGTPAEEVFVQLHRKQSTQGGDRDDRRS